MQVSYRKVTSNQNVLLINFKSTYENNALSALKMSKDARQINLNKQKHNQELHFIRLIEEKLLNMIAEDEDVIER